MDKLAALVSFDVTKVELQHAIRLGYGGKKDEVWVPQIADEGWMVITADDGRRPTPGSGEKLPVLCRKWGVTYAVFSRSIRKKTAWDKVQALVEVWGDIPAMRDAPRGSGFSIRPTKTGHYGLVLLRPGQEPFVPPPKPTTQANLILPDDSGES